jgi:hypothetical protein
VKLLNTGRSVFALNLALRPVKGTRSSLKAWAAATARDLAPYALVTALMTPITFQANQLGNKKAISF